MGQTRDRLAKLVGLKKAACITRDYPSEPTHRGFVLGLGRELVLLHQFHDFYPEGYTALRVADIRQVRSGNYDRFWTAMLRGEGLLEQVGIPYEVPLDNFRSLLTALHARGQHVIIVCEQPETEEKDFFIGPIVALDEESMSLLYFDPMGKWDAEPSIIAYRDITKIEFDTPYVNTITKYLKEPPSTAMGVRPSDGKTGRIRLRRGP